MASLSFHRSPPVPSPLPRITAHPCNPQVFHVMCNVQMIIYFCGKSCTSSSLQKLRKSRTSFLNQTVAQGLEEALFLCLCGDVHIHKKKVFSKHTPWILKGSETGFWSVRFQNCDQTGHYHSHRGTVGLLVEECLCH